MDKVTLKWWMERAKRLEEENETLKIRIANFDRGREERIHTAILERNEALFKMRMWMATANNLFMKHEKDCEDSSATCLRCKGEQEYWRGMNGMRH